MYPNQEKQNSEFESILKSQSETNSLIIGVSVGSKPFEGEGLSSLVNAINMLPKKIKHCTVAVCDTLQRHNYKLDGKTSEKDAHIMAKGAGDQWIEKNTPILNRLKISWKTTRWDKWLNDIHYTDASAEISDLFDKDEAFQEAVKCSISTFSSRFTKRHEELGFNEKDINQEILVQSCRDYLLEECAIIMKLWPVNKNDHCEFILYPGKMTKALGYAYEKFVVDKNSFKWNKFTPKKIISLSNNNSALFNSQEKVALSYSNNQEERFLFLSSLAACISIMTSNLPNNEKLRMLSSYTVNTAFLLKIPDNDTFESTSKEGNFLRK